MNILESEYRLPEDPVRLEGDAFEAAQTVSEVSQENTEILPTPERRLSKISAIQESIRNTREKHLQQEAASRRENRFLAFGGKIMGRLVGFNPLAKRISNIAMLIDQESYIGGQKVFEAPPPQQDGAVVERRFFYDYDHATGSNDWFFDETTTENNSVEQVSYWFKVKDEHGVYLSRNHDGGLEPVTGTELDNFTDAVDKYHGVIHKHIYSPDSSRSDYDLAA
jgi:hypothetical protein